MPTLILERVDDSEPDRIGRPTDASRRADVRGQQVAPPAAIARQRVTASVTPRCREQREPAPATPADEAVLISVEETLADDAAAREKQV